MSEVAGNDASVTRPWEDAVLPQERRQYLDGIQDALAGLDEARVVLAGVVERMEKGRG